MIIKTFKIAHSGKNSLFKKMVLGQLIIHIQKNEFGLLPLTLQKVNSEWTTALYVRAKTKKLAEENIDAHLHDLQLVNDFLDIIPKAKIIFNWISSILNMHAL